MNQTRKQRKQGKRTSPAGINEELKIVAWNCQGLGNRSAVRGLLNLQKTEELDILFLSETKHDKRIMERFWWMLGLTNMLVQDGDGKRGGGICSVLAERS